MCAQMCLSSSEMGNEFSSYRGVRALDPGESKNQRAPWGPVTHTEELEVGGHCIYLGVSPRFRQQAHFSAPGGIPTTESHSTTHLPLPTHVGLHGQVIPCPPTPYTPRVVICHLLRLFSTSCKWEKLWVLSRPISSPANLADELLPTPKG